METLNNVFLLISALGAITIFFGILFLYLIRDYHNLRKEPFVLTIKIGTKIIVSGFIGFLLIKIGIESVFWIYFIYFCTLFILLLPNFISNNKRIGKARTERSIPKNVKILLRIPAETYKKLLKMCKMLNIKNKTRVISESIKIAHTIARAIKKEKAHLIFEDKNGSNKREVRLID